MFFNKTQEVQDSNIRIITNQTKQLDEFNSCVTLFRSLKKNVTDKKIIESILRDVCNNIVDQEYYNACKTKKWEQNFYSCDLELMQDIVSKYCGYYLETNDLLILDIMESYLVDTFTKSMNTKKYKFDHDVILNTVKNIRLRIDQLLL